MFIFNELYNSNTKKAMRYGFIGNYAYELRKLYILNSQAYSLLFINTKTLERSFDKNRCFDTLTQAEEYLENEV